MNPTPTLLFAELPEAEGRDLSIEMAQLPAGTRIERFTYRGDPEALLAACEGADAVLTDYAPFDAALLGRLTRVRMISVMATGWDCVDTEAAAARGIAVSAVGEYCTEEVADHALAMLLALNRRLLDYDAQVRRGKDWRWDRITGIRRLAGQTLGILGFGRIGQAVCRRALGFGLEVIAHDPWADSAAAEKLGVPLLPLTELLERSDILTLHCNLTPGSRSLLDRAAFAQMARKPMLLNVARGALIDEAALADALDAGQVSAAGLDVLVEDSPDLGTHPLAGRDNVLLTPHVAFYSETAMAELRRISARNAGAWLEGKHPEVFRWVVAPSGSGA